MPLWTVGILTDSMQARPFTEEETEARKAKRFTLRVEVQAGGPTAYGDPFLPPAASDSRSRRRS